MRLILPALAIIVAFTVINDSQFASSNSDPKAFHIATRAGLLDAFKKIDRYKIQLTKANKADKRRILEALLRVAQDELNDDDNSNSVIAVETEFDRGSKRDIPVRWHGAFKAIEELIVSTGDDGLKVYDDIYGGRAKRLLENALADNDADQVHDINRRFGLTDAGRDAALHLARVWFEQGKFSKCGRALERVLEHREMVAVARQATVSAWLAHCYRQLGERANLQQLISDSSELKDKQVDIGGQSKELLGVLREYLDSTRDSTLDTIESVGVETVGGNYANTGLHDVPVNYTNSAWSLTLPRQQASRGPIIKRYAAPMVPSQMPLFDGNFVYVNNGDSLLAYDLLGSATSMKPAWVCRPFPTERHNWYTPEPDTALVQTVSTYQGMVYAAIENPLSDNFHKREADGLFGLFSHYPKPRRALCGVDSATGRILWKRGGLYEGTIEDQTNFLHSIVHNGTLYAIATRVRGQAEIFMYAIEPESGKKLWSMRLCYGQQETTMFGRPAREPITSIPAFAGGQMYLCTNIGGVVAVNLQNRSISWISRYQYIPRPVSTNTFTIYRPTAWFNSPTIYTEHEGKSYVVIAPADSSYLLAMDATDGTVKWKINRNDSRISGALSLVGVRKGLVYIAAYERYRRKGRGRFISLNVSTGKVVRTVNVTAGPGGKEVSLAGRPCMTTSSVLWPAGSVRGRGSSIVEIGLDSMGVLKSTNLPASWGGAGFSTTCQHGIVFNIIGKNYTAGNVKLNVRYDAAGLLNKAREALKAHPNDPEAALRYGQLAVRLGNETEGLKYLKHAFTLAEGGNRQVQFKASFALVGKYLESADKAISKRRYNEASAWVQNARRYSLKRLQLTECFLRDERILTLRKDAGLLNEFYELYINDDPAFGIGADPEVPVRVYCQIKLAQKLLSEGNFQRASDLYQSIQEAPARLSWAGVSLRVFALVKLRALMKSKGRGLYAQQDHRAKELLADGKNASYQDILGRYPLSIVSDEAALRLAEFNRRRFVPEASISILRTVMEENPDSARKPQLQAQLAVCLHAYGENLRSRLLARRLLREFPQGELSIEDKIRSFVQILTPLTKASGNADVVSVEPRLPSSIRQLWGREWNIKVAEEDDEPLAEFRSVLMPEQPGIAEAKYGFVFGSGGDGANKLLALDLQTGELAWSVEGIDSVSSSWPMKGSTLFAHNTGFVKVDDSGAVIWRTTTLGTPRSIDLMQGMVVFTNSWFDARRRRQMVRITALDASTGGKIWEQSVESRQSHWIKQVATGILLCASNLQQNFFLLDYETGDVVHSLKHAKASMIYGEPIISEESFKFIDQRGQVFEHSLKDLKQLNVWQTGESHSALFREVDGLFFIVGFQGATCYDPATNKAKWRHRNKRNEATVGNNLTSKTLFIVTRLNGDKMLVYGLNLKTGEVKFSVEHPRDKKTDQILLMKNRGYEEGIVLLSLVQEINRGVKVKGFRCLVFQDDGTIRADWKINTKSTVRTITQMQIVDKHIMFTCGKTLYCLGNK
ncbi:MAG: PQQ-binding-like beta-propeller repeat protein [Planctomycetota bacterium]